MAAREILDRSGLTPEIRVSHDTQGSERDARLAGLRIRLDAMRTSLPTPLRARPARDYRLMRFYTLSVVVILGLVAYRLARLVAHDAIAEPFRRKVYASQAVLGRPGAG